MIALDKLVEVGFTYTQATNLSILFRNIGYLTVGTNALKDGIVLPPDKTIAIDTMDTLNATLKADSQEYMDISKVLVQKGNMNPNRGRANVVIVYFAELANGETFEKLVTQFISVNANWTQLLINSNNDDDILDSAKSALLNNRLFVAQTTNYDVADAVEGNIAVQLKELNNANTLLTYHTVANESLAAGLAGIMANPNLGSVGALYSTVTDITPENHVTINNVEATVNQNLDNQNVTYYSSVNAVNGGSVSQYASPIVMGAKMITGEDAKRRYIRYYIDLMMKARCIDFLKKKLGYEDVSADILLSMLKAILKGCQTNGLVKQDSIITSGDETIENLGYELKTIYPSELREVDETLYNSQTYRIVGYYRDSLTGRKVEIDLFIDPSEAEKTTLGF